MIFLEYGAFLLALCSCLAYGKSVRYGAGIGIISAVCCIAWGILKPVPAAVITNVGFLLINGFNLYRSFPKNDNK